MFGCNSTTVQTWFWSHFLKDSPQNLPTIVISDWSYHCTHLLLKMHYIVTFTSNFRLIWLFVLARSLTEKIMVLQSRTKQTFICIWLSLCSYFQLITICSGDLQSLNWTEPFQHWVEYRSLNMCVLISLYTPWKIIVWFSHGKMITWPIKSRFHWVPLMAHQWWPAAKWVRGS